MKNMFRASCVAVFVVGLLVFSLPKTSSHEQISSRFACDIEPAQCLTIVVIFFGAYFTNSVSSQGTNPPLRIGNRTSAFEVVNIERAVRRVRLTLKNN